MKVEFFDLNRISVSYGDAIYHFIVPVEETSVKRLYGGGLDINKFPKGINLNTFAWGPAPAITPQNTNAAPKNENNFAIHPGYLSKNSYFC